MSIQLTVRDLTKRYKTGDGVSQINLDVKKGELVTLLGPSGCGKTTVLRSIGGFLEPDSGDILIEGRSVIKLPPEKRPTSMVFQSYNLWPHMSVYDNLAFGLKIRKMSKAEIRSAVSEALKLVRLPGYEKKYPTQLSGGQQQRVALARSLLLKPAVLLLDEPFSALDAKLRHEMREELREIQMQTGLTMVFVTHDQEEALSLSDRIVVMNHGHIEQIAEPQRIYDEPATLYVARFIGKMNFLEGVADGNHIRVGRLTFPNAKRLNGRVTVAVRPEDVSLNDAANDGDGLAGKIKQMMILGHYAEVSVELPEYGVIRTFQSKEAIHDLWVGKDVGIAFARMIAYPVNENNGG
ncbi:ABC transporter ATP-binding protein [Paenibacillus cisolokensis]|jgi:ABC-type spermidine/putrescine transport systems, ATPase components|uniref:Iron ABC transporter ATP-binding protein n=1 Tax=Paenibacillus cisolokensis TaxID=1658519 RepID=A0ABQ4NB33_9BACL|nr:MULTISPECIES: ABC transporter ATP-binding protein [Paenibacillus]ALS28086.1 ABC transporter [Paenibacillus sp. 32O-W]GIQ65445.1 iron ABC transporter ATP-binding protein [Paenibacillus cisolokensis]